MNSKSQIQREKNPMKKNVELHPDLKPCLVQSSFGDELDHPLVRVPFYDPQMAASINESYCRLKSISDQALEDMNYKRYLSFCAKEWRLHVFHDVVAPRCTDPKLYYELLADEWMLCENIWQYQKLLLKLLDMYPDQQRYMMTRYARKVLASLPDVLTIYRGASQRNKYSMSWTLSRKVAQYFADRYRIDQMQAVKARVYTAICKKKDVIALITKRREKEIVIEPKRVKVIDP